MNGVRAPVGAGSFYPGRALELGDRVDELLAQAESPPAGGLRALVAPHAGYRYSGAVASSW